MTARIICVGSRLSADDDAGPRVFDALAEMERPAGVEVIEGGLAGLDLLGRMEGVDRVVFVDSVRGFGREGEVVVLDARSVGSGAGDNYGHGAGLGYLLRVYPEVWEGPAPEVMVVGIEGTADELAVRRAAAAGLALAREGE